MRAVIFYLLLAGFLQNATAGSSALYDPDFHLSFTEPGGSVSTVVLLPDEKLLIGGFFQFVGNVPTTNVARINRDGTVDSSFRCSVSAAASRLLIDSQGRVYGSFGSFAPGRLQRLFPDGTVDPSFQVDFQSIRTNYARFSVLSILPESRLLVAAFKTFASAPEFLWVREDGTVDSQFLFESDSNVRNVIQQSDGKILVVRSSNSQPLFPWVLDRLDNGRIDPSFTPLSALNLFPFANDEFLTLEATGTNQMILTWRSRNGEPLPGFISPTVENAFEISSVITYPDADPTIVSVSATEPSRKYFRLSRAGALQLQFTGPPLSPSNPGGTFPGSLPSASLAPLGLSGSRILTTVGERSDFRFVILNSTGNVLQEVNPRLQWPCVPVGAIPLASGQFLVHGAFLRANSVDVPKVARINSNGTVDVSFGSPSLTNLPALRKILPLPDGKILGIAGEYDWYVAGETENPGVLVRLSADGALDSNFQSPVQSSGDFRDLLPQPDGKVIALGSFTNDTLTTGILRLNEDGSIDQSFDSSSLQNKPARLGTFQPDGKLLISLKDGSLLRLEASGTIDPTFQFSGHVGSRERPFCLPERILLNGHLLLDLTQTGASGGYYYFSNEYFSDFVRGHSVSASASATIQLPDGHLLSSGAFSSISNGFAQILGFALLNKTNAAIERIFQFPPTSSLPGFPSHADVLCAASQNEVLVTAYSDSLPEIRKLLLQGRSPPKMQLPEKRWDGALQLTVSSEIWTDLSIETSTNLIDWLPYHQLTLTTNSTGITDGFSTSTPQRFFRARSDQP